MSDGRSLLAVPASNLGMVDKALASEADAVFLDLEDAVAPSEKGAARTGMVEAMEGFDWRGRTCLFRMNALNTPWSYRDVIEVAEGAGGALGAIIVPKVEFPDHLRTLDALLTGIELNVGLKVGGIRLEAQIETARGLVNVDAVARATPRLRALHFGPGDYAASVRMPQTSIGVADKWDAAYPGHRFHYAMQRIVVAVRAAGLRVLDGPVADYRDESGLRRSCGLARALGFDGKWCIHPAQVGIVNEVFSPTERELEWAEEVIRVHEEASTAGSGAVGMDGRMLDSASVRIARGTLELARRVGAGRDAPEKQQG